MRNACDGYDLTSLPSDAMNRMSAADQETQAPPATDVPRRGFLARLSAIGGKFANGDLAENAKAFAGVIEEPASGVLTAMAIGRWLHRDDTHRMDVVAHPLSRPDRNIGFCGNHIGVDEHGEFIQQPIG